MRPSRKGASGRICCPRIVTSLLPEEPRMAAQTPDYSVPDYLRQLRLDGRNFVVLGAGQGIGEATTHALAQAGARVLCVDREEQLAVRIAQAVKGGPFTVH